MKYEISTSHLSYLTPHYFYMPTANFVFLFVLWTVEGEYLCHIVILNPGIMNSFHED